MTGPTWVPGADETGGGEPGEDLLPALRAVLAAVDPAPEGVVSLARAAFTVRDLDAELAVLVADSLAPTTSVRSGPQEVRLLSLEVDGTGVDLQLTPCGGRLDLVGQALGDVRGRIAFDHEEGTAAAELDERGRFDLPGLPHGRLRLRWVDVTGRRRESAWLDV